MDTGSSASETSPTGASSAASSGGGLLRGHDATAAVAPSASRGTAADAGFRTKQQQMEAEAGVSAAAATGECPRYCHWTKGSYTPSAYETLWMDNVSEWQNEDTCARAEQHAERNKKWLEYGYNKQPASCKDNPDIRKPQSSGPAAAQRESRDGALADPDVFSFFTYTCTCPAGVAGGGATRRVPIEPIVGPLRSPEICQVAGRRRKSTLMEKRYILIDEWASRSTHGRVRLTDDGEVPTRSFYFDAGATMYSDAARDHGASAAQEWFLNTFASRCVAFDGFWGWEMKVHNAVIVFAAIPESIRPIYHWYNIPASPVAGHGDNPLEHIRAIAKPEDFVVFKLDIDAGPVEEAMVQQMLADPELLSLIDEFFWEHHVKFTPMTRHWTEPSLSKAMDMDKSMHIFQTLRQHGILSHSWV